MFILIFPMVSAALIQLGGLPRSLLYSMDFAWIVLLGNECYRAAKTKRTRISGLVAWILLFFICTVLVYLVKWQSPLYLLWGIRNNFRYYVVFFALITYMSAQNAEDYLKLLDGMFYLNFAVTLIQNYLFGYRGDELGGIFGVEAGCNGSAVLFLCIVITKSVVYYLEKKETVGQCLAKCACALYVAALSELKFFYVIFIVIIVMALVSTAFSWRKLLLVIAAFVGVSLGTLMLAQLFDNGGNWFTLGRMLEVVTSDRGYTSSYDLNRFTAIPMINELWLLNAGQRMFGLGLGNCDVSSFAFLQTPFYVNNGDMHYTWISYAMMYLETGWIGLMFYWGFFVAVFMRTFKLQKHGDSILVSYCRIGRIMAAVCIAISIYNASLRMEAGYMVYTILAMPFAVYNNRKDH